MIFLLLLTGTGEKTAYIFLYLYYTTHFFMLEYLFLDNRDAAKERDILGHLRPPAHLHGPHDPGHRQVSVHSRDWLK